MLLRTIALILALLCHPALAETQSIPDITLSDLRGKSHSLRAPEHQVLLLAKPNKKSRQHNQEWMKALVKEFQGTETRVWLVADLSARPPFASKERVKKKLKTQAPTQGQKSLLLDWDGKLRRKLDLDSQHHVYLLGPGGKILAHTSGLYRKEKVETLARAR